MSYWNDGTPQKLIDTIPQLSQDDYPALRRILLLHSQHQQRCEEMMRDGKGMSFEDVLRWDSQDIYNLYIDLTYDNQVLLKNRSLFRYRKASIKELSNKC